MENQLTRKEKFWSFFKGFLLGFFITLPTLIGLFVGIIYLVEEVL